MIKKNKKLTWALLVGVVIIYVTIVYKSYANQNLVAKEEIAFNNNSSFSPANYKKEDFIINMPLTDPFHYDGTQKRSKNHQSDHGMHQEVARHPQQKVKVNPQPIPPKPWPVVKYFGFVKKTTNAAGLCLLTIDNKLVKVEQFQAYDGIQIKSIFKDSLIVQFKDELKTIQLE